MYKPFDLSGRTAVVTGGNGGIGMGMAKALLASGAQVAIWGNRAEKTAKARDQLAAETGGTVNAFVCDVGAEAAVERTVAASVQALGGRVDACFANAGVSSKPTPILQMTAEEFRRVMRVNVEGVFYTFRAAAMHMKDHGGGSLVATASTAAVEGAARNSHYGASKGAVTSYCRALAVELARYQIRVNSILPGWIATEMTERSFGDDRFASAVLPRIPARRWGSMDDFGGLAVYLASDAAGYTTGEQFVIDGGYTKF